MEVHKDDKFPRMRYVYNEDCMELIDTMPPSMEVVRFARTVTEETVTFIYFRDEKEDRTYYFCFWRKPRPYGMKSAIAFTDNVQDLQRYLSYNYLGMSQEVLVDAEDRVSTLIYKLYNPFWQ